MGVQAVPQGYHRVNIHLTFKDATQALAFYEKAFGGERGMIMPGMGGRGVMHAEVRVGDTTIFLADDMMGSGKTVEGGHAGAFVPHINVADADATWKRAIEAGCKEVMPLADQFWGARYGQLVDPFGLRWAIATQIEEVTPEELGKRAAKMFSAG